jgi:hypothetical protein
MIKSNAIQSKSSNSIYVLLVFIIFPLLALYISIKRHKELWAKNVVWLFCGYYGYTFVIGNKTSDINRYKSIFESHSNRHSSFEEFFNSLLREDKLDFIQPMLSYLTSILTGNFHVFLTIIGLIFGFFLSRNIWSVLSLAEKRPLWYGILFIFVFTFIFAIWDINVMRFTMAAQIFFYGVFNHFINKKKWGIIFIFISPFMHFSFIIAIFVYLIYKFFGNFTKLYFLFFLVSFTFSEFNIDFLKNRTSILPALYNSKSEDYISEDYIDYKNEKEESKNFTGKFYQSSLKWSVGLLMVLIYLNRRKINKDVVLENLFAFALLFIAVFNILSIIPSMNRFQFVAYLFAFALFYSFFNGVLLKNEKIIIAISAPFILFYLFVKLRIGLEFTGLFTIFGGPLSAIFNDGDIALIEYFK